MGIKLTKSVQVKEASNQLELLLLLNDIIQSRTSDLSSDILEQVIADMKASPLKISFKFDEIIDVESCS